MVRMIRLDQFVASVRTASRTLLRELSGEATSNGQPDDLQASKTER